MKQGGRLHMPAALSSGKMLPSRYPPDRRLGGPQSRSGRYGEEKNLLPGIKIRSLGPPDRSLVAKPTELSKP
jgi:hypothetical protein